MNNALKNIALIGAGYIAFIMLKSSKDTVKANSLRGQILDIDLDWSRIRLTINMQNPTNGNIVLRSIYGDLYVNGDKVANVSYSGYTVFPANSQNHFNIEGKYITPNVGRLLADMFKGRKRFEVFFRGSANINSELMPMDFNYTLGG